MEYSGTELCPYCGMEFDFIVDPYVSVQAKCTNCGKYSTVCSLCDKPYGCGGKCDCQKSIIDTLNDIESEAHNRCDELLEMCVYYDTVIPNHKHNDNLAYLYIEKDMVEYYFDNVIWYELPVKISFEKWFKEYTADDVEGLYVFARDRDAIRYMETPDGKIMFKYANCDECDLSFAYPENEKCVCHRCGKEKKMENKTKKFAEASQEIRETRLMETVAIIMDVYKSNEKEYEKAYDIPYLQMINELSEIAREFETIYYGTAKYEDGDYIELVEDFAKRKLQERYGRKKYRCVQVSVDVVIPDTCTNYEQQIENCINNGSEFTVAGIDFVSDMTVTYKDIVKEIEDYNN